MMIQRRASYRFFLVFTNNTIFFMINNEFLKFSFHFAGQTFKDDITLYQ